MWSASSLVNGPIATDANNWSASNSISRSRGYSSERARRTVGLRSPIMPRRMSSARFDGRKCARIDVRPLTAQAKMVQRRPIGLHASEQREPIDAAEARFRS
jgi:hypothetical protein